MEKTWTSFNKGFFRDENPKKRLFLNSVCFGGKKLLPFVELALSFSSEFLSFKVPTPLTSDGCGFVIFGTCT